MPFLLLTAGNIQAATSETILNTALSVTLPEVQSGNPGDFITYVLQFENRSNNPITLETEFSSPKSWGVIGDAALTVPARTSNYYFPVTIQIPPHAPADRETVIELRLRPVGEVFWLTPVRIPVQVNPLSTLDFSIPPPQRGLYGSTVVYTIMVANNGNTTEQLAVKAESVSSWEVKVLPATFSLPPGASQPVVVEHAIPFNTNLPSDRINLTFSWGSQQRLITLTTMVADKLDELRERYYIWQGQVSIGHSNLANYDVGDWLDSFSLAGQWNSRGWLQLYFSNLLNSENRLWYSDIKYDDWEVQTGDFSLSWPGLVLPPALNGNLLLAQRTEKEAFSFYLWEPDPTSDQRSLGLIAEFPDQSSTFRLLHNPQPSAEELLAEWEYQYSPDPDHNWFSTVLVDLNHSDPAGFSLKTYHYQTTFYWNSGFEETFSLQNYRFRKRFWFDLGRPQSDDSLAGWIHLDCQSSSSGLTYEDYRAESHLIWPSRYGLLLALEHHLRDSELVQTNYSWYFESPIWTTTAYERRWWVSYSKDESESLNDQYFKLFWATDNYFRSDPKQAYLLRADLVKSDLSDYYSRAGIGYSRDWQDNQEFSALLYYNFSPSLRLNLELGVQWQIYQHQLAFNYSGLYEADRMTTNMCSLVYNQRFSVPVKKPLGTIQGLVFLDLNKNGYRDRGEPPIPNIELSLDGQKIAVSDSQGRYQFGGIKPELHALSPNSRSQIIYALNLPSLMVNLKAYQTATVNIPLIRNQNIIGQLYLDQNFNRQIDPGEAPLAQIPVVLQDLEGREIDRAYTAADGSFALFQLSPGLYQLVLPEAEFPEDLALPPGFLPIKLDSNRLEELPDLQIGLIPYEKPIVIVNPSAATLWLTLDREVVFRGGQVLITIESNHPLTNLILTLPNGEVKTFITKPSQRRWSFRWTVPANSPTGQVKLVCQAEDTAPLREEVNLIILASQ